MRLPPKRLQRALDEAFGALREAIREELAAARGGAPARHAALKGLGFGGMSELLSYRPA
jgi:hypothetical protein